jgi:uncharacterized protein
MPLNLRVIRSLNDVSAAQWDALAGPHPLLSHAFLHCLERTGCTSARAGWQVEHLSWWQGTELVAALPLYRKMHSYGEYVFDWSWAQAFEQAGGAYYPKLTAALPFTPCPGARLLLKDITHRDACVRDALDYAERAGVSSLHVLLCDEAEAQAWGNAGAMLRTGVQFHWTNPGVVDFDAYLATMTHDKRKRIKQERRKVRDAGVTFRVLVGAEITPEHWQHFYRCYAGTYAAHRSTPYLSEAFFVAYAAAAPEAQVLIVGEREGTALCAALNWRSRDALYGRYWGALDYVPGLHFEACYYQALDWGITQGIQRFEGGAQGEHKLARGFMPVTTHSAHWIAHPQFSEAIERFLKRERAGVAHAVNELEASSPFKS